MLIVYLYLDYLLGVEYIKIEVLYLFSSLTSWGFFPALPENAYATRKKQLLYLYTVYDTCMFHEGSSDKQSLKKQKYVHDCNGKFKCVQCQAILNFRIE